MPPQQAGKRNNELWGNRIPSMPSGNSTGSLRRSATLSVTTSGRARRVSASDVQLGFLQTSDKALESSSVRQPMVVEEDGCKGSDMLSSLDIATPVTTSSSLAGRGFGQSASSPERSTLPQRDQDQTGMGENRDLPSVVVSSDPISGLDTDDTGTSQSVPEDDLATAPANDAVEGCCNSNPDYTPLPDADNNQIPTTVEEHLSSSLDANQSEAPRKADETLFNAHVSPLSDISQLEVPLEVVPVGSSPAPAHFANDQPVPPEPLVTVDEELSHGTDGDSPTALETTGVEEPENNGKCSGKPVILDDQFVALTEANPPRHPAEFATSFTTQSHTEYPSLSPSLSYDSSLPPGNIVPSSDVGPGSQPVVHSDQSPHSESSAFVSTMSSTTLDSSSTLDTSYLIDPHNLAVTDCESQMPSETSPGSLSVTSTPVPQAFCESPPLASPILDAFPDVPQHVPSTPGPGQARAVSSHRPSTDRGSTSSTKSTPSLSFSIASSSTGSPTSASIATPQLPPDSRRPAAALQRAKSQSRPISFVPSLYDDDSDEEEAGWANVVVTRRYY
ncbi:hypothetical protein JB92DRAFT_1105521 [Gautieria morchelliformis]|nr:hypothetical protein JB92DRAFT_1105521 [Gautieria morchelliformis]